MMMRPLLISLVLILTIDGLLAAKQPPPPAAPKAPYPPPPPPAPKPQQQYPVKNATAGGRYYGGGYAAKEGGEYEYAHGSGYRLVDDYICDLDASILVVTNSEKYVKGGYGGGSNYGYTKQDYAGGRGGAAAAAAPAPAAAAAAAPKRTKRSAYGEEYAANEYKKESGEYGKKTDDYGKGYYGKTKNTYNVAKAHRLRCSAIAVNSDEDCRKCCHMAARKERSVSKESIIGFIVDYDELQQPSPADYKPYYRRKREAYAPAPAPYGNSGSSYGYSSSGAGYQYNYPQKPKNARCVCCAPKTYKPAYDSAQKGGYSTGSKDYGAKNDYKDKSYGGSEGYEYGGGGKQYEERKSYGSGEYGKKEEEGGKQYYGEHRGAGGGGYGEEY